VSNQVPKPDFMTDQAWKALMAGRRHESIRDNSVNHVKRYLDSNGAEGTYITQGGPTLVLATIGRKSGDERLSVVNFMPLGEDVAVVGSIAGLDKPPHWALNLEQTPRGWIQIKGDRWDVTARKITGTEREALWPELTAFFPLWGHFQKYCDREFSVFILSRADGSGSRSGKS